MGKQKLTAQKILKEIENQKENIKKFGVIKIGLFGSFIKGKEHKKSDIDILVTFDEETFDNYSELFLLLQRMFRRKIDIVVEEGLIPELNYVKKEAKYVRL